MNRAVCETLFLSFQILVQKFVNENISLQISTLYATQVFCYDSEFPKGELWRQMQSLCKQDLSSHVVSWASLVPRPRVCFTLASSCGPGMFSRMRDV